MVRAFSRRRATLLAVTGRASTIIVGPATSHDVLRLQGFFARHGHPCTLLDPGADDSARSVSERFGILEHELPFVVCANGTLLKKPSDVEVAAHVGISVPLPDKLYDVAIIGAGPAGLATSVYAASEGLSVIVFESHVFGGQAGASARIENYLGFPTGVDGQDLMARAFNQATKFGTDVAMPTSVTRMSCDRTDPNAGFAEVGIADGATVKARTVVIATGVRYRRPDIDGLAELEGHGVSYWASPAEGKACLNEDAVLIGGGNSAGQAAVFLATKAKRVHVIVRRKLAATMSRYLIDRIEAQANIVVRLRHLFSFIGADPNTDWLDGCAVTKDAKGFIVTGKGERASLETNIPGIFAIGDVRAGSVKRVAAAVGEGAAVVAQIHAALTNV